MSWKLAAALGVAILLLLFAAQNYQVVEVRLLVWKLETSRAVMILGVFGAGVVVGSLISGIRRLSGP